jgi:hypothetical protein
VVVFQVPTDRVGAGVQPGGGELLAELDDQVDHFDRRRGRAGLRSPGPRLEHRIALGAVAGHEHIDPGLGDAVLDGDVTNRSVLDHHSGDQQTSKRHARTLIAGRSSVRDLRRHQSTVS